MSPTSVPKRSRGSAAGTPDRWLADFAQADFKDEVRPLILKDNAVTLLGLR